jgi:hypothetical protein
MCTLLLVDARNRTPWEVGLQACIVSETVIKCSIRTASFGYVFFQSHGANAAHLREKVAKKWCQYSRNHLHWSNIIVIF